MKSGAKSSMALIAANRYSSSESTTKTARPKSKKPVTYEDNFNFCFSFYQPMIEYLDKKLSGLQLPNDELPHLPYMNERALLNRSNSFTSSATSRRSQQHQLQRVRSYTDNDFKQLIDDSDRRARLELDSADPLLGSQLKKLLPPKSPSSMRAAAAADVSGLTSQYSMSKKSIRTSILSKSEVGQKLSSQVARRQVSFESPPTLKRSRSFGAFTDKAVQDVENEMQAKALKHLAGKCQQFIKVSSSGGSAQQNVQGKGILQVKKVRKHTRTTTSADGRTESVTYEDPPSVQIQEFDLGSNNLSILPVRSVVNTTVCAVCSCGKKESAEVQHWKDQCKQMTIEIEQLSARLVEAETRLKTEVVRIKKKMQIQITELEMSLDVANKNNIELQKTIKKYSISLTEIQAQYDEVQRQLQIALDQYGCAQRRATALQGELDEVRSSMEAAMRAKRAIEQLHEEAQSRVNELTTININLQSVKTKIEQELGILSGDYDEVSKELKMADDRYQKVQVELSRTVEILHEEQERIVKIESIKKTLEIEVKNLTVRLEEVETNALVGGKRIISKLEARLRDLELELEEEKRRHAESVKILRKKDRQVKEIMVQIEEDQKNISLLNEALDKVGHKANIYKRQLQEQESLSQTNVTRVRRFQRELEAAEERADSAESNLSLIRAKHRSFVTSSVTPGANGQVYVVQETRTSETY